MKIREQYEQWKEKKLEDIELTEELEAIAGNDEAVKDRCV